MYAIALYLTICITHEVFICDREHLYFCRYIYTCTLQLYTCVHENFNEVINTRTSRLNRILLLSYWRFMYIMSIRSCY